MLFPDVGDVDLIDEASDHVDWLQKKHPGLRGEAAWTYLDDE